MADPITISKKEQEFPTLDFDRLRKEGVAYVQELAGDVWTDYNEHDPGVTILEQLCYAMTDLGYRTENELQNILWTDEEVDERDTTLYTPGQILPCHPVTIMDYRKLIIDASGKDIKNAWVEPLRPLDEMGDDEVNGLYQVELELSDDIQRLKGADKEKKIVKVIENTRKVLNGHRNLCEDFHVIKALDTVELDIVAEIEIHDDANVDTVMAYMLFELENYFSRPINFYSLKHMMDEGVPINYIFEGPELSNGFIKNDELRDKPDKIYESKLIKIILDIDGVESVRQFSLSPDINNAKEFKIPKIKRSLDEANQVKFYKGNIRHSLNFDKTKQKFFGLRTQYKTAEFQKNYRKSLARFNDVVPEKGANKQLETYYSIQNGFPRVYGIGPVGIPQIGSNRRKAQARQLKGYLLFFEQVLANYLSQLAHAKDLFSTVKTIDRTYFYQPLYSVPDVNPLFKNIQELTPTLNPAMLYSIGGEYQPFDKGTAIAMTGVDIARLLKGEGYRDVNYDKVRETDKWKNYRDDDRNSYFEGLGKIMRTQDDYAERRHRFLDHLLARFSERVPRYTLSRFNKYYTDREFSHQLLNNKMEFLRTNDQLSRLRGHAFDYSAESWNTENVSGLARRVSILLDINDYTKTYKVRRKSLADVVYNENIHLKKNSAVNEGGGYVSPLFSELSDDEIDNSFGVVLDIGRTDIAEDECDHNLIANIVIDEDLLEGGFDKYNYKVGLNPNDPCEYLVVYRPDGQQNWRKIGGYASEEEAKDIVRQLVPHIKRLNIESEGFHIIEHVLLRPDRKTEKRGFKFLDSNYELCLMSIDVYDPGDMQAVIHRVKCIAVAPEYYHYEMEPEKGYYLVLCDNGKPLAKSMHYFGSPESPEAKAELDRLIHFFEHFEALENEQLAELDYFPAYYKDNNFYTFKASVILPAWPARFKDNAFKKMVEHVFRANAAAHIHLSFIWLNVFEMKDFEELYKKWLSVKTSPDYNPDQLNGLSYALADELMTYRFMQQNNMKPEVLDDND